MNDPNKPKDRDEVLFAFHQQCDRPTAEQIIAWVNRFPQFADDIRAHAAVSWDWALQEKQPTEEADESLLARAYSQALNIIYNEEHSPASHQEGASQTFQQMLSASKKEVYQLARELDIDRSVLADLFNGWMLPPVCERLANTIATSLRTTIAAFDSAMQFALKNPYVGHAKSANVPIVKPRSCEEIIQDSNMSPERKRYWLGKD